MKIKILCGECYHQGSLKDFSVSIYKGKYGRVLEIMCPECGVVHGEKI